MESSIKLVNVIMLKEVFGLSYDTMSLNGIKYYFTRERGKMLTAILGLHDLLSPIIMDKELASPIGRHHQAKIGTIFH